MPGNLNNKADLMAIVGDLGNIGAHQYNVNAKFRRRFQTKLARAYAGGARLKIACLGDSQTVGPTSKATAYPAWLAKLLRNAGFIVSEDSMWGDSRLFATGLPVVTAYDPKLTFENAVPGTGWTRSSTMSIGGNMFYNNGNAEKLIFTPSVAGQNIDIYFSQVAGGGSFTISDAASVLGATVNTSGSNALLKTSRTRTLSANPINIARTTGGGTYLSGIDQYANDTQISIFNCGAYGSQTSNWVYGVNAWDALNTPAVVMPDLIVFQISANDYNVGTDVAVAKARLQTCISTWKALGIDIILQFPFPHGNPALDAAEAQYWQMFYELAFENELPLNDLTTRFVSYTVSQILYIDDVHLGAYGNTDVAFAVWELLRPQ